MKAMWLVRGNSRDPRELLDFTFNNAEQDVARYLKHPFWASRYPRPTNFSWVPFYREFATRLLEHRNARTELAASIVDVASRLPMLNYLAEDQYAAGGAGPLSDVDPFTVMGAFNRGITPENRRQVAQAFADLIGVTEDLPGDFDGIPLMNNQNSWFVRYQRSRGDQDIDSLWRVFAAGLALADEDTAETRNEFARAYDAAVMVKGVHWNLSQGLYWARPDTFVTLEFPVQGVPAHALRDH